MDLQATLEDLPDGWTVQWQGARDGRARYVAADGWVNLTYHELLPGIVMTNIDLACQTLPVFQPFGSQPATINWCAGGRCEVDFGSRGSLVVGAQRLCLSSSLAHSFAYPTRSYQGFEYFVDFDRFDAQTRAALDPFGLTEQVLHNALVPCELGVVISPDAAVSETIRVIQDELASEQPRHPWLLLGTFRLFMLLAELEHQGSQAPDYLQRSQRDMAQAVYQQIQASYAPTIDLAPLAQSFGVSQASLRGYFARLYGQSPAAYARSHALLRAAELLVQTNRQIADIAQTCGYENPSKFSAAFRRAHDITPLEYRRRSRLDQPLAAGPDTAAGHTASGTVPTSSAATDPVSASAAATDPAPTSAAVPAV